MKQKIFSLTQKQWSLLAIITTIITCIVLYLIERNVFGGAVQTDYAMIAGIVVVLMALHFLGVDQKLEAESSRGKKVGTPIFTIFKLALMIIGAAFTVFALTTNPYMLLGISILGFILTYLAFQVYGFINKKFSYTVNFSKSIMVAMILILVMNVAYLLFLQPCTPKKAKSILSQAGYQELEYKDFLSDEKVSSLAMQMKMTAIPAGSESGVYCFDGYYNEKDVRVYISLSDGSIIDF